MNKEYNEQLKTDKNEDHKEFKAYIIRVFSSIEEFLQKEMEEIEK